MLHQNVGKDPLLSQTYWEPPWLVWVQISLAAVVDSLVSSLKNSVLSGKRKRVDSSRVTSYHFQQVVVGSHESCFRYYQDL